MPGPDTSVSACVITLNEADRIDTCLRSLAWCDEIVVVDSHSTDATRDRAAVLGARVIERDWPGHAAQKEFAIRSARNDWVVRSSMAAPRTANLSDSRPSQARL